MKDDEKILLISSITQIVYLNFKDYAVVNCSVEIAKRKIFIMVYKCSIKNISKDKYILANTTIKYNDLPVWFQMQTKI